MLKPIILQAIIDMHRQQLVELVAREKLHPQEHAKYYDKYSSLITKQVWFHSQCFELLIIVYISYAPVYLFKNECLL